MNKYERHLSALAMMGGVVVDQLFFGRIDLARTQAVFIAYIVACVVSMAWLHLLEERAEHGAARPRWRALLPFTTQFALGGFWSGFVFFYGRAGVIAASWPYLALLVFILIANEVLKKYHDRLVFTNLLFFFALFSYTIFEVPIYTGTIGVGDFLLAGIAALAFFALFGLLLSFLGRRRYRSGGRAIALGTAAIYLLINLFYFTGVVPPLPLSLRAGGIYHSVSHQAPEYLALTEPEPLLARLGLAAPTEHLPLGAPLYAYSAVFAPVALMTTITHRWEWYDPQQGKWLTEAAVAYPIAGGRDGGYLGYSAKAIGQAGQWRVDIETIDGRVIGRLPFTVEAASSTPALTQKVLN
jgi:hypothetical protein